MNFHDFILVILAFLSELVGTLSGFGSSTFFVPSAVFLESLKLILVLTSILHLFGNISRIYLFKEFFHRQTFLILVIPSIAFTGLGAIAVSYLRADFVSRLLGAVLILISMSSLIKRMQIKFSKWVAIPISAISGFTTGLVGTGGAIRGLALSIMGVEKNTFVSLSASIDVGGDFLRALIYLRNGFMDWNQWFYIPLLGLSAIAGAKLGKKLLSYLNQKQFDQIVSLFVALSGLLMLLK